MGDGVAPLPTHCRQSVVIYPTPHAGTPHFVCAVIRAAVRQSGIAELCAQQEPRDSLG